MSRITRKLDNQFYAMQTSWAQGNTSRKYGIAAAALAGAAIFIARKNPIVLICAAITGYGIARYVRYKERTATSLPVID